MADMNLDDVQQKLKDLGIDLDAWGKTPGGSVKSPILERQKDALLQIKKILEEQVGKDKGRVADLHITLQRLKHGGGV